MSNKLIERIKKLIRVLHNNLIEESLSIKEIKYLNCDYKKDNLFPNIKDMLRFDNIWNQNNDGHAWFYFHVDVDKKENTRSEIYIKTNQNGWDASNPQFLVYLDGEIVQGLDTNHLQFTIPFGKHDIYLYAYKGYELNSLFCEEIGFEYIDFSNTPLLINISLRYVNLSVEELYFSLRNPYEALKFAYENKKEYNDTINYLNEALKKVDFLYANNKNKSDFYESCNRALQYINDQYYNRFCKKNDLSVACIGHTHIDIGWLWPVRQTREKVQRSFATQIALMKEYPEYKFMSSQAYLYQAVKEEAPELFSQIKKQVNEGRWEVEGAMWVEADCNIPNGESLVRQILVGKKYFKENFNVDCRVLWLPDVFGYSAALPQILKKSGIDTFVTSKISWNDTNVLPYDIFNWQGIDGTKIFTYFLTAQDMQKNHEATGGTTYVGMANPSQVAGSYNRLHQKELTDEVIITYGYGDGGGGPTRDFIENIKRMEKGIIEVPSTRFATVTDFLDRLKKNIKDEDKLPIWTDELYLEFHRGTYTSIAKNKYKNRRAEYLLTNIEKLAVINNIKNNIIYPKKWLDDSWKMVLTNQFHDIIPGSAITEIYDVTDEEYAKLFNEGEKILFEQLNRLATNSNQVFNPNDFVTSGFIMINNKEYYMKDIPAFGFKKLEIEEKSNKVVIDEYKIENQFYLIEFNDKFEIISLFDKVENKEILKDKASIIAYEDYPNIYQAWEIRSYYQEKKYDLEFLSVCDYNKGIRKGKKINYQLNQSLISVIVTLNDYERTIHFETDLDWNDDNILLKHVFPIDIDSNVATCDIQFGSLKRNTSGSTSWDQARFEFCSHKFVDVSDDNYGISLINEAKYGYSCENNYLALTLLKCSNNPSDSLDKGKHQIKYELYSHQKSFEESDVDKVATVFNNPFIYVDNGMNKNSNDDSFIRIDKDNVHISSIKRAENNDDIIVRLYEYKNRKEQIILTFNFNIYGIYICDLMENEIEKIEVVNNETTLNINAFEIVTLRIKK